MNKACAGEACVRYRPSDPWLGCQDSNLGMAASKAAALPLGDTPKAGQGAFCRAPECGATYPYRWRSAILEVQLT